MTEEAMPITEMIKIKLVGCIDALTAPTIRGQIERAVAGGARRLVLDASELLYLSSAGLRLLGFVRQLVGHDVSIVVVGANDPVKRTIHLLGPQYNVLLQ
jgi:stage II sporulation protein AA (anti-sigma F factor antagonist)